MYVLPIGLISERKWLKVKAGYALKQDFPDWFQLIGYKPLPSATGQVPVMESPTFGSFKTSDGRFTLTLT